MVALHYIQGFIIMVQGFGYKQGLGWLGFLCRFGG